MIQKLFLFPDRGPEQAPLHHVQAHDVLGQPLGEGLHQEEEQVVRVFYFIVNKKEFYSMANRQQEAAYFREKYGKRELKERIA